MTSRTPSTSANPLISICMNVYNAEDYVERTLESILAQDYPHFELLLSDNGSHDRSIEICRAFAERDPRIIYSRNQVNVHPSKNSERMLYESSGQFHMWAADHDIYHPKFISSLLNAFRSEDESLVLAYPTVCHVDHDGTPMREIEEDIDTRGLTAAERFKKVLWGISCCTAMYGLYRSSAIKEIFKIRWVIGPDVVFLPEFSLKGTFAHVDETLFFWRQNRPVERYFELNERQAELLVRNDVEKLAPAMMRDHELLMVVQNSGLEDHEKVALHEEVLNRHQSLPEYKLSREVRYLLHEGVKRFESGGDPSEKRKKEAGDFYRVGQIAKQFCRDFEEQLDHLCALCRPYLDDLPAPISLKEPGNTGTLQGDDNAAFDRLIPPEIKNDAFYHDIVRLASQEEVSHILEIGSSSGQGSTSAFVTGIHAGGDKAKVYCMEISKARYQALRQAYEGNENVICYQASSVAMDRFPSEQQVTDFYMSTPTTLNQYPLDQVLGWLRQDKAYVAQTNVRENGIQSIKMEHGIESFDLVLIDGSEFTGSAELDEVYGAKIIMLDDINSYKNYEAYQRLKSDPAYRLEKENWQLRNGYAIFRRAPDAGLPIHFFTIVLNGEPFIGHHLERLEQLDIPWHWHIIEGVADLKHDTAWSLPRGGRIPDRYHQGGLSVDGTTQYLDRLARENPEQVTVYRKPDGAFWDGKLEMVSAPLPNLPEHCLLWQIDADELWETDQIKTAHRMFTEEPGRTAAFFHCHFFVGPDLVTTTTGTYSHNTAYEWLRLWRYEAGMQWKSHEPPQLMRKQSTGWVDTARMTPFSHQETESRGLVFSHYAYALESQVRFKEDYYGYEGAVGQWEKLQAVEAFPVRLSSYFGWVHDHTLVDRIENRTIGSAVPPVDIAGISDSRIPSRHGNRPHVVIDGVIFQLQAGRPQGISRVWTNLLAELNRHYPQAAITVLEREGYPVPVSLSQVRKVPAYRFGDEAILDADDEMLRCTCRELKTDLFISTYYTRAPGVANIVMIHDLIPERFGYDLSIPEWLTKQRAIETGDGFMCVSNTTRDDLLQVYPRALNAPVEIVPNGLDPCFKPSNPTAVKELRQKLGLAKDYLLMVGNRQGYKSGVTALQTLSESGSKIGCAILCVGGEKQLSIQEQHLASKLDLHYTGQLSDAELATAYSGALALLVPSKYEGFGLPVIEAMACGCPVIAEASPAVKEVGGEAVMFVDMHNPQSMLQAVEKVCEPAIRKKIIDLGKTRAERFNWSESATRVGDLINTLIEKPSILLTAVVSTYKAARFIHGCLEDLEQQTMADRMEIIVVDSGSPDDEAAVVRDFQRQHANIKYIRTSDRESVYQAWNRGIKFAKGKYVSNANTDDRHRHDAFERMVGVMEADENIALVYADVIKTLTANETFRDCTPTGVHRWPDWDRNTLLEKGCFIGPQPVWRKDVHNEYGYFDEDYEISADFEFWLRISQTNQFYHISQPLGLYMDRSDSVEHANTARKRQEDQSILDRYRQTANTKAVIAPVSEATYPIEPDRPAAHPNDKHNNEKSIPNHKSTNEESMRGGSTMHSLETIIKAIEHLVDSGHQNAALWAMEKLVMDYPDSARLHNEMAAMAYEHGEMQTAAVHFEKAAELEPGSGSYLKDLGNYYYVVEKNAEKALDQYERVLKVDPGNTETLVMAGHVSISLHRYTQGQSYYERALEMDPQNAEIRQLLEKLSRAATDPGTKDMSVDELYGAAQDKLREGDRESAASLMEQLLAQDDTHALAHNDLGVLFYESGDLQAALTHYEKAAGLQPENEIFQKNLADFYLAAMVDHERAMKTYIQVLKLNPRDVEALLGCGQICLGLGKDDDAGDFFNTALEIEPWNENAQYMLRQLDQGSTVPAPDTTDLHELAKTKAANGDLHGAITDLNQYVGSAPNNANAYNDLGVLYFETGDKDSALAAYEKAVQLDPNDTTFQKNLADFYLIEQGRAEEALKIYLTVLEDCPQDVEALIACGMVCTGAAKVEDAKFFYHRVLEIEPWNEIAQTALTELNPKGGGRSTQGAPNVATG